MKTPLRSPLKPLLSALALLALATMPLQAEDVIVTSTVDFDGTDTACPPSCPADLGTTTESATYANVTPNGPTPRKSKFGILTTSTWEVQPTLADGAGIYKVYVAKGTTGSCPTDLRVACTVISGISEMRDTNGVVQTSITTPYFAQAYLNDWYPIGEITVSSTTPRIRFSYSSGGFSRWYMDAVRFQGVDCGCCGVTPPVGVTGPLAAGQTDVNVTAVSAFAINVTVYANHTNIIGWLNPAPGFAGTVTVLPLVRGDTITATQTILNATGEPCTSDQPASGPIVGSGGPKVIFSLGCRKNTSLTGPIGAPTPNPGNDTLYWVKATGTFGGNSATAPVGGWEVIPSQCWQTFAFNWQTDPCRDWFGNNAYTETNAFAVLDSLAFGIDPADPDSGPYDIYIDKIMNGTTVIADFEGFANDAPNVNFANPNATTTPPPSFFLSAPMSSRIAQNNVFSGTNSCRVQWQFADISPIRWCRLLMNRAPLVYPQLDTTKPVTVSVLVLPAGVEVGHTFNGTVSPTTNTMRICPGAIVELGVTVTGPGPYTYQWNDGSGPIPGATDPHYPIIWPGNPPYSVTVSDGTCSVTSAVNPDASVRPVTLTGITGTSLAYSGGNGCQFVLLQSPSVNASPGNWTRVQTNTVLPGSFTIPAVGTGDAVFYRIQSE